MAERRPTMMDPPVESLLDRVDSKFTLVTLAAMGGLGSMYWRIVRRESRTQLTDEATTPQLAWQPASAS